MKIKNGEDLLSVGDPSARRVVLDILEGTLRQIDTHRQIRRMLTLDGDRLGIGSRHWDLSRKRHLYVVGGGKAGNAMARAVEDVLGDRITAGIVVVKHLENGEGLRRIELATGGHPLPNEKGLEATRRIQEMVGRAGPEDLFIGLISGGSSALMSCPAAGITLADEIATTEALLKSGARILEINAVRRHISAVNGGRLARAVEEKGAEMINLIVSDAVGNAPIADPAKPVKFFGTPVAPDATTLQDAWDVLKKYGLGSRIPRSVAEVLDSADPARETPKTLGDRIHHFVLLRPADACEAALKACREMGINAWVLTTLLEGESREAGTFLACVAKEIALNRRPVPPPCVVIAGGETTTVIDGSCGTGGPSQELALSFALEVEGRGGICLGAIDTDGTDGPTRIAGAIVDGTTVKRTRKEALDPTERLRAHDSGTVLAGAGDLVVTGNTGTNLCDLNVIYVA